MAFVTILFHSAAVLIHFVREWGQMNAFLRNNILGFEGRQWYFVYIFIWPLWFTHVSATDANFMATLLQYHKYISHNWLTFYSGKTNYWYAVQQKVRIWTYTIFENYFWKLALVS